MLTLHQSDSEEIDNLVQVHEDDPEVPIAVVNKTLTSVCLFVVRGSRQSDLAAKDILQLCHSLLSICSVYPEAGTCHIFRVFQVVAAALDNITRATGCFVVQHFGPAAGNLLHEGVTTMQACIHFVTHNEACSEQCGHLSILVTFALRTVFELKNWSIHDPDAVSRWSQIIDCMQDQFCHVLDCIQHYNAGVVASFDLFAKPTNQRDSCTSGCRFSIKIQFQVCIACADSLTTQMEPRLHQLAVIAAAMLAWIARNAKPADVHGNVCSCMHSLKEVLPVCT